MKPEEAAFNQALEPHEEAYVQGTIDNLKRTTPRSTARAVVDDLEAEHGVVDRTPPSDHLVEHDTVDNWKHRSKGMKCATCMYYVPKVAGLYQHDDGTVEKIMEGRGKIGRCRRRAPTLNGWPVMQLDDWCGQHKLDEEKVDGN